MAFEVRNSEAEATLKKLGDWLRENMPEGFGFALLLFEFGPDGSLFYTANANRQDVVNTMREFIAKYEPN